MFLATLLLLTPALLYLAGAALARDSWLGARRAARLALLASLLVILLPLLGMEAPAAWLTAAPVHLLMSVLVSLIGLLVVQFSVNYLAGDSAERPYRFWLQTCLAGVSLVVVTNHLLLLWLGWTMISISLHQLLVCYPGRFRAVLAAHKKFIFARIGETALLVAALLLWLEHDTFQIDRILAAVSAAGGLTMQEQTAAVLLALAALFKCAQMPVHGWLIQVVEAPTPVSALLHAGVINLGGFLMIMMAPLMVQSEPARWLLLLVAGPTAVLAALIMMTRISIKVSLAWSTTAQMGLMLVECALGLYELALLHLVAHSCYKAHAFLTSGETVNNYLRRRLAPAAPLRWPAWLRNMAVSLVLVGVGMSLLPGGLDAARLAAGWLVVLALSFWLPQRASLRQWGMALGSAALLLAAYLAQKTLFAGLLPDNPTAGLGAALWVVALGVLLVGGYALLARRDTPLGDRWHQWLFAGLYLDEWVTRTTLKLWPVKLPMAASRKQVDTINKGSPHERLA